MHFLDAIAEILQKESPASLRKEQEHLSAQYRKGATSQGVSELAYLATRCPAIFGAVQRVLRELKAPCSTLLDLGAGPGTATWAAFEVLPGLKTAHLFEKNRRSIALGKEIAQKLRYQVHWHEQSLEGEMVYPEADCALVSYALGELKSPDSFLERLWRAPISCLILLEPGTPRGYQTILRARTQLLSFGAFLVAPCPHAYACPLKGGDWCHFSTRIERSRLHRAVKGGALGYEDEKYSYLIASRTPIPHMQSRILRHPAKHSGHVRFTLCTLDGKREEKVVARSEGEAYKRAKDAKWGDLFKD